MARKHIVPSNDALRALRKLAIGPWQIPQPERQRFIPVPRAKIQNETDKPSSEAIAPFASFKPITLNTERSTKVSESRLESPAVLDGDGKPASDILPVCFSTPGRDETKANIASKQTRSAAHISPPARTESTRRIHQASQRSDYKKAASILYSTCLQLAETGDSQDWTQVRSLIYWYSRKISSKYFIHTLQALVERLLDAPAPRYEAVELLLLGTVENKKRNSIRATSKEGLSLDGQSKRSQYDGQGLIEVPLRRYLQTFCHHHRDVEIQFEETMKIYRGLELLSCELNIDLMLPALRSARYTENTNRAHKLFVGICEEFDLIPSTKILHVLLQYFSRVKPGQGDWSHVNEIIALSHDLGYSRSKSNRHALLVLTAAIPYARTVTPTRLHDFLTYHVQESGLIPTRELNRWIFIHYLEAERFDLAQKWAQLLYSCFPGTTHVITTDPIFAHDLTCHWEKRAASCTDILTTCRILTHGAIRNPFSDDLRLLIRESVSAHLRNRAKHAGLPFILGRSLEDLMNMDDLLDSLQHQLDRWQKSASRSGWHSSQTLVHQELASQVEAARTIALMLEDYQKFLDENLWIVSVPITPAPSEAVTIRKSLERKIISVSGQKWLQGTIDARLANFEQETNIVVLQQSADDMVTCLSSEGRYGELALLLQKLSDLPVAVEIMTSKLLREWINAAFRSSRFQAFRYALWKVVESPIGYTISLKTLLFVCNAIKTCEREGSQKNLDEHHLTELQYLKSRIFRRWWMERRCPNLAKFDNTHLITSYRALVEFDKEAHKLGEVLQIPALSRGSDSSFKGQEERSYGKYVDAVSGNHLGTLRQVDFSTTTALQGNKENDMEEGFEFAMESSTSLSRASGTT